MGTKSGGVNIVVSANMPREMAAKLDTVAQALNWSRSALMTALLAEGLSAVERIVGGDSIEELRAFLSRRRGPHREKESI